MRNYRLNYEGYWREENFNSVPTSSGLYTFMECTHNKTNNTVSLLKILYIGKADDLRSRITGHEKLDEMRKSIRTGNELCVNIAAVNQDIDRIENAQIFHHKPPFNQNLKDSFNYDTTAILNCGNYSLLNQSFTVYTSPSKIISRRIF